MIQRQLRSWAGQTSGHEVSVMCGRFSPDAVWTPAGGIGISVTPVTRPSLLILDMSCESVPLTMPSALFRCLSPPWLKSLGGVARLRERVLS